MFALSFFFIFSHWILPCRISSINYSFSETRVYPLRLLSSFQGYPEKCCWEISTQFVVFIVDLEGCLVNLTKAWNQLLEVDWLDVFVIAFEAGCPAFIKLRHVGVDLPEEVLHNLTKYLFLSNTSNSFPNNWRRDTPNSSKVIEVILLFLK